MAMALFHPDLNKRIQELILQFRSSKFSIPDHWEWIADREKRLRHIEESDIEVLRLLKTLYRLGQDNPKITRMIVSRVTDLQQTVKFMRMSDLGYSEQENVAQKVHLLEREIEELLAMEQGVLPDGYRKNVFLLDKKTQAKIPYQLQLIRKEFVDEEVHYFFYLGTQSMDRLPYCTFELRTSSLRGQGMFGRGVTCVWMEQVFAKPKGTAITGFGWQATKMAIELSEFHALGHRIALNASYGSGIYWLRLFFKPAGISEEAIKRNTHGVGSVEMFLPEENIPRFLEGYKRFI